MAFYPEGELNNDASNWWGPNPTAVEAMLRVVGFHKVQVVHQVPSDFRVTPDIEQGRLVVHAWR